MKTFGILGLGSIGLRHALNLIGLGHDVKGYDPDPERMKALQAIGGTATGDPNYVLDSDAMVIATPTPLHAQDLAWALEHGRHVLCEKPISDRPLVLPKYDAELIVALGCNQRFHPCVQRAKEWLSSDPGKVFWAEFTVAQKNTRYTDPVALNWGSHELDLARYLLGEAEVVGAAGDHETMHAILWHPERGCHSTVTMDYNADPWLRGFTLSTESGVLHADLENHVVGLVGEEEDWIHYEHDVVDRLYVDEAAAFVRKIDGYAEPVLATIEDGLATLDLILKIQELSGAVGQGSVRSGVAS